MRLSRSSRLWANPIRATQFSASGTFRPEGTLYDQLGFVTQWKPQRGPECSECVTKDLSRSHLSYLVLNEKETNKRLCCMSGVDKHVAIHFTLRACDNCKTARCEWRLISHTSGSGDFLDMKSWLWQQPPITCMVSAGTEWLVMPG